MAKLIKHKHQVYKRYNNVRHPAYIRIAKEVKMEVKKSKVNFEQKLAEKIKDDKKSFLPL